MYCNQCNSKLRKEGTNLYCSRCKRAYRLDSFNRKTHNLK